MIVICWNSSRTWDVFVRQCPCQSSECELHFWLNRKHSPTPNQSLINAMTLWLNSHLPEATSWSWTIFMCALDVYSVDQTQNLPGKQCGWCLLVYVSWVYICLVGWVLAEYAKHSNNAFTSAYIPCLQSVCVHCMNRGRILPCWGVILPCPLSCFSSLSRSE